MHFILFASPGYYNFIGANNPMPETLCTVSQHPGGWKPGLGVKTTNCGHAPVRPQHLL
jgi:hypothetical protein